MRQRAVPGIATADMEETVAAVFREHNATPLFLGYPSPDKGRPPFPAVVCGSVDHQVVHGIPNRRPLKAGEIVSIDTGCKVGGWSGDSATALAIGEVTPGRPEAAPVTSDRSTWRSAP